MNEQLPEITIEEHLEQFEREQGQITEIIILSDNGAIRRLILSDDDEDKKIIRRYVG